MPWANECSSRSRELQHKFLQTAVKLKAESKAELLAVKKNTYLDTLLYRHPTCEIRDVSGHGRWLQSSNHLCSVSFNLLGDLWCVCI